MDNLLGLYVHVPFCLSKCPYCDFYSIPFDEYAAEKYTSALCRAIKNSPLKGCRADTVYFGGGTPVLLGSKRLSRIFDCLANQFCFISPEITIEANPAATVVGELAGLRAAGFNRVSFGVQSGIDSELKELGRLHDASEAKACIIAAQKAGFENISADLMLGIPRQTRESLAQSINFLLNLPVSHVSAYMLKIEEGTPFASMDSHGLLPGEDELAAIYLDCVSLLEASGFNQYEISNFAKDGAKSRHNLKYWRCMEYVGFGPSAHSYTDGLRYYLPRDVTAFIEAENPLSLSIPDGEGGGFEEYAMLRLRLNEGLDLDVAESIFGIDASHIAAKARELERNGLVTAKNGVISLTPEGFLLSNSVTAALLIMNK